MTEETLETEAALEAETEARMMEVALERKAEARMTEETLETEAALEAETEAVKAEMFSLRRRTMLRM